jgi:hypothetical protein
MTTATISDLMTIRIETISAASSLQEAAKLLSYQNQVPPIFN